LPTEIPSSLNGKYGKIRYYVEACMATEWEYDIYAKTPFTVIRLEDISKRIDLMEKRCQETISAFGCFGCKTKALYLKASIPFTGYASGQEIRVTIYIFNKCGFDVSRTVISLKRQHTCNSIKPEKKVIVDSKSITKTICEGVKNNCEKKILGVIAIPKMTLNSTENSLTINPICKLSHFIQVSACVIGFYQSPKVEFKVTIGTKPLNYEYKLLEDSVKC